MDLHSFNIITIRSTQNTNRRIANVRKEYNREINKTSVCAERKLRAKFLWHPLDSVMEKKDVRETRELNLSII